MSKKHIDVLDHGFVKLRNLSGPVRRPEEEFDASDRDPAITARISFDLLDADRAAEQDHKLVKYLMANKHWTPVEMIEVWLEMKLPIFVARQFVRHRTACLNEVSARYATLPAEWYVPDLLTVGLKSSNNKQGRDISNWGDLSKEKQQDICSFLTNLDEQNRFGYQKYTEALEAGIAPELARCFLQVNHYTHWVWKQDLRNMLGFLTLRLDSHAQYEARVYAQAIYDLLKQHLPETMKYLDEEQAPAPVAKCRGLLAFFREIFTWGK